MSPNGRVVGTARYPFWLARIQPFYDSDEEREILFYPTAPDAPGGLRTCFGETFWLARECSYWPAVGTVIGSEEAVPGATHGTDWGEPIGDPDWFVHGISREALLRGEYGPGAPRCDPFPPTAKVGRVTVETVRPSGLILAETGRVAVEVVRAP